MSDPSCGSYVASVTSEAQRLLEQNKVTGSLECRKTRLLLSCLALYGDDTSHYTHSVNKSSSWRPKLVPTTVVPIMMEVCPMVVKSVERALPRRHF